METHHNRTLYKDYLSALLGKEAAEEQVRILNAQCRKLELYAANLEEAGEKQQAAIEEIEKQIEENEKQIAVLEREVARLQALLGIDGTNSGTPTSQTPIGKKKVIPNSREKSGKKKGGQPGHEKAKLKKHEDYEITEHVVHKEEVCPDCGGRLEETSVDITKPIWKPAREMESTRWMP